MLGAGGLIDDSLFRALLSWHLAVDVIFLLAYGCLLAGLVSVLYRSRTARWLGGGLVAALVAVDLLENICLIAVILTRTTSGWATLLQRDDECQVGTAVVVGVALLLRFVTRSPQRAARPRRGPARPRATWPGSSAR